MLCECKLISSTLHPAPFLLPPYWASNTRFRLVKYLDLRCASKWSLDKFIRMVKTVARLVTGCLIMKSCHVCIRWLKRFPISYEKDGTLSIYLSHNSLMCITLNPWCTTLLCPPKSVLHWISLHQNMRKKYFVSRNMQKKYFLWVFH